MTRKPFVCGNWKLHHNLSQTSETLAKILAGLGQSEGATLLFAACQRTASTHLQIAAQNVFYKDHGAYTGEWSVHHLLELGCRMAIVGHSERRQYFNETNESVAHKAKACFEAGVTPIVCVGETLEERQKGETCDLLAAQISPVFEVLKPDYVSTLILAYEPVWAIGTGKNATTGEAEEVHAFLRSRLSDTFGSGLADQVRIVYGGSVKPDNAAELMRQKNVDGALVGGASLSADSFLAIVQAARIA
jgi:triosephosphate isomerase